MEYCFISAIFGIFVECAGCFCIWNTLLRADITFSLLIKYFLPVVYMIDMHKFLLIFLNYV